MCEPTTIAMAAGAAMTAAGALAKGAGQAQAGRAQAGVAQAELARQRGYRDASGQAFDKTLGSFEKPKQDAGLKTAQDSRAGAGKANINIGNSLFPSARAPAVIADAYKRANDAAGVSSADYAGASGRFAGYGDLAQTNDIALGRGSEEIGKFGSFARGSAAVTPLEYQAAGSKGSTWRGIGDVLMGAGNIASLYGFTAPAKAGAASGGWFGRQTANLQPWYR